MSIEAFNPAIEEASPLVSEHEEPSRTLAQRAAHDTFSRLSARLGAAWLGLLAIFAVFGPFLADTHPLLMKSGGHWSSPALAHLTQADVLLLIATFTVIVLGIWRRFSWAQSGAIVLAALALSCLPILYLVHPPENMDYTVYRDAQAAGHVEHAIMAPIPYSPSDRLRDQSNARLLPPSAAHWLGTDTNGADLASLLIHASRIALSIGFLATSIAASVGILVGGLMGYYVGALDLIGMRFIEIFEAVPRLFLLISITAFIQDRNIYLMMTVIGLTSWTGYARFLRAEFFTIRKLDYVQAAIAAGLPEYQIVFRHMLANALTPILVSSTFGVASAILSESILTFLGLGLIDQASWGGLLDQARAGGSGFIWWIAVFPGLAIFLTVFSYNLIGEALRDALDPKLMKRD